MTVKLDPKIQEANDRLIKAQADLRQKMQNLQIKVEPIGAIITK
ncbi:hypothetical protein [Candidatus Mycosynbacter amalyticus]|nr:hypothetical protein [Candidatus Mycosynbacter amalyticus]